MPDARHAHRLENRLLAVGGTVRAEVNDALGVAYVACDVADVDVAGLIAIVEEAETEAAAAQGMEHGQRVAVEFPGAAQRPMRAAIRVGASVAGAGLALAGRVSRVRGISPAVPALVQLIDYTPRLRAELERRLGRPAADTALTVTLLVTQTAALRPLGLLVEATKATCRFAEERAVHAAWLAKWEKLASREGARRQVRAAAEPRPAALRGVAEQYADVAGPLALAAYGAMTILARRHQRGLALLIAGTPKAGSLGREAFAAATVRALAAHGAIILDPGALRRLDMIDTVVLDAGLLTTGGWVIEEIKTLAADVDADTVHARVHELVDRHDPSRTTERHGWVIQPAALHGRLPHEASKQAAEWARNGATVLAVTRNGALLALAGAVAELDPMAEALVAAARSTGTVVLAGKKPRLNARLRVDAVVAGGTRMAATVRSLQAAGHGVAVVSHRAHSALAQADLGIGIDTDAPRLPWDADLIADMQAACLALTAPPAAREVTRRCVRLSAASACCGAFLAMLGPRRVAVSRAYLASDASALVALATGEWAGRGLARQPLPVPADRMPWHAMPAEQVLARLGSSMRGLRPDEAAHRLNVPERPAANGPRALARAFGQELANPLTPVLAAGAGISAVVGSAVDAVLIFGVLAANALAGGAQRLGADRALTRLVDTAAVRVWLRRGGMHATVTADQLVLGDVVKLQAGDPVPADCRLLRAAGLEVDESMLTGESQPVAKESAPIAARAVADRRSMLYEGTTVVAGDADAVVVATGASTEAGRTVRLVDAGSRPSGVELRLRELSRRVLPGAIGSGVVLLVTDLLRGQSPGSAVAPAVSLAVAAVPEGLPFVATVAELAAARRLAARRVLVRNPSTIEALGRVDVLCFDKTGTLTEGRISLRQVSDGQTMRRADTLTPVLRTVVSAALRATPQARGMPLSHPTDRAIVAGAGRADVQADEAARGWQRIDEIPFEPGRGYHAVLGRSAEGLRLSVKGSPEAVLVRCESWLPGGVRAPLDHEGRRQIGRQVDALARRGYRVLAVAERATSDRGYLDESRIKRLCFLGLIGLADPIRATAAQSITQLRRAGVRVLMITGDHPSTAESIAAELDALNGRRIMTGAELDDLDDEALAKALPDVGVFARVTPAHKVRIVRALRDCRHVVAVTGDGANDAPAIRMADVGVALGAQATAAARTAADVVVTDDRIETIIDAVVQGRGMWSSVRDSLSILLGGNLGEIIFILGSSLFTGRSALNARQILLVNLLTDMVPAMAVALRPPRAASPGELLAEGPEASLGAALSRDIYLRAGTTAGAATISWCLGRVTGTRRHADTVALAALVAAQLLQTIAVSGRDRVVIVAGLGSLAALGLILSLPGLSHFFGCRPIGPSGWMMAAAGAGAATVAGSRIKNAMQH